MLAAIAAFVNSRVGGIAGIEASVKVAGRGWIDDERVERTGRAGRERQQPPGRTGVVGAEQQRVARADQQRVAISGVDGDGSGATAKRPGQMPTPESGQPGGQNTS